MGVSRQFLRMGGGGKCSYIIDEYSCYQDECVVYVRSLQRDCSQSGRAEPRMISRQAKYTIVSHMPPLQDIMGTVISYGDGEVWPEYGLAEFA